MVLKMDTKKVEGLKYRVEYGRFNFEHLRTRLFSYLAIIVSAALYLGFSGTENYFIIYAAWIILIGFTYINQKTLIQMMKVLETLRADYKKLFKELNTEMPMPK